MQVMYIPNNLNMIILLADFQYTRSVHVPDIPGLSSLPYNKIMKLHTWLRTIFNPVDSYNS